MKVWTRTEISYNIANDDHWLERALIALTKRQTEDEKVVEGTKYRNGKGYRPQDARFMTSLTKVIEKGYKLSDKQKAVARRKIIPYLTQLMNIANQKG
jgi:hypothetical protein